MSITKIEYLERFLVDVDRVMTGRPSSITKVCWFINYYDTEKFPIVSGYLDCNDKHVKTR